MVRLRIVNILILFLLFSGIARAECAAGFQLYTDGMCRYVGTANYRGAHSNENPSYSSYVSSRCPNGYQLYSDGWCKPVLMCQANYFLYRGWCYPSQPSNPPAQTTISSGLESMDDSLKRNAEMGSSLQARVLSQAIAHDTFVPRRPGDPTFSPALNNNLAGLRFEVGGRPADFFVEDIRFPDRSEIDRDGTRVEYFRGFHFSQSRQRGRRDGDLVARIGEDYYLLSIVP